uniref:hypothetical protein n=1 Tax=Arcticibacter eurypsychrophilus TaxID=1434752 RepID=UPI001B8B6A66
HSFWDCKSAHYTPVLQVFRSPLNRKTGANHTKPAGTLITQRVKEIKIIQLFINLKRPKCEFSRQ